ncbi:hypothetical protein ACIB24_13510 [Spongisporangium articulatum]|uniref:Uncharacterized protein n=1 Tax=Spongisporangium articulatum TaxID=3362603 RepID=A0ABW8ANZ1_9ACTN
MVIPTVGPDPRACPGILLGLRLAADTGCRVLVIRSGPASEADFPWDLVALDVRARVHVIDFDDVNRRWHAAQDILERDPSGYDVAAKRNLALVVAVVLGWEQVLFLDDDMEESPHSDGLNAANVAEVGEWMRRERVDAVGWSCTDFPDNSVVCHARRLAGRPQSTFIGAGALLVAVSEKTPFFPDMYNEDWFFLIALAAAREDRFGALGRVGTVTQEEYDPYTLDRVERQERGDVLAEGLLNLLEDGGDLFAPDSQALQPEFWRRAVRSRLRMITALITVLHGFSLLRPGGRKRRNEAVLALRRAEQLARGLDPVDLAEWVRTQPRHLERWARHLHRVRAAHRTVDAELLLKQIAVGQPPAEVSDDVLTPADALLVAPIRQAARPAVWTKVARKAQNRYAAITGGPRSVIA